MAPGHRIAGLPGTLALTLKRPWSRRTQEVHELDLLRGPFPELSLVPVRLRQPMNGDAAGRSGSRLQPADGAAAMAVRAVPGP